MSRISPNMRDLAQRLIEHETKQPEATGADAPVSFAICANLRPHLATLMGSTGFRVLLSRALGMAKEIEGSLRLVQVTPDGALEMVVGSQPSTDLQIKNNGSVELVAQLFALLAAFIGEDLTWRIVKDAWPKLPPANTVIDKGKSK